MSTAPGKVYLVGAGPGDPLLITLKGRDALARAHCVLFDHLANEALLAFAPADAERLYVGKKKSDHALSQDEICALLIDRARAGLTVVRLKGGDPFIFGRGGEEAEALAAAGIPFEVVPGVTTPLGIAAYSGVPLTHREHTSSVTFVTGHDVSSIDWRIAGAAETLVVFMGLTHIAEIARAILAHGRSPETPALAVRWATYPHQQTVAGTLADIATLVEQAHLKPPATLIIGDVVRLRATLNWYERLPLFGRRIVVTRAPEQAGELSARLQALGAEAIELPVISLVPPEDPAPLDAALARLDSYDWVVFTSANGVRFFLARLDASPNDLRRLRARLCAIGPATRAALASLHLKVDLMPESFVAESLVESFSRLDIRGKRVLLARAAEARELIPESLRSLGATVDVVPAYRNIVPPGAAARAAEIFTGTAKPHWITFTSSSTVTHFLDLAGGIAALDGVRVASIGPVTSATLRNAGRAPDAEARSFTIPGLIDAIVEAESRP
jgi:uroporphyrinogen III methyltransferase/synthase